MGWAPLSDDIPLDHEALQPPQQMMGEAADAPVEDQAGKFAELPDDAPLDAPPAPQIQARVGRDPGALDAPLVSKEVNPTYTEQGFSNEVTPDPTYHSSMAEEERREYAAFFKDPAHPPTAAQLQAWYHQKTGGLLENASEIVEHFAKHGKFSTHEKVVVPTKPQNAADAYADHTVNAMLGDWSPEVTAPLDALGLSGSDRPNMWNSDADFTDLWAQNADLNRAQLERDSADHPIASGAGEMTGVAATIPLGMEAANLARVGEAGTVGRGIVQGMGEGAIYGSGAAGPGHRGEGAAFGAATVPVVGAALKVPGAVVRAGKTVLSGSPSLARRIVAKAIKADENTAGSVGADISAANANDVPMMIADTGENARGTLAAATRSSGPARTIARDALETRQAGLADRVTAAIERDLGPVANPHQVADTLMTKARTDAAPLYETAYAKPGASAFGQKIAPLLARPSMKKALANAYRLAQEEGRDPTTLGFATVKDRATTVLDASGKPMTVPEITLEHVPSWQTLDYIKRGMDDVVEGYRDPTSGKLNLDTEGRAVNNTLRTYLKAFDVANPDYAAARAAYSGPVSGIGAMNAGRKALTMTADDLEARMRDMTPFDKQMFALGARRSMAEAIASKGDTANVIGAIMGTGKKRAMLGRLFGDRKTFQRFVDTMGQEREGWRTFARATQGSAAALNLEDDATLKFATTAADMALNGGLPIVTALREAVKFGVGKVGDKAKQEVAALLSETDPARFRELAEQLRAEAVRRGIVKRKTSVVTNAGGKAAVALQPGQ